jgi:Protein of unknown function (DUF3501)
MRKVALADIMGPTAYENARERLRQRIIKLKQARRVAIGDKVTLLFENRDTVIFQIQEMVRAEKITDLDKVREEVEVYNDLIPYAGELSATLFLEITEQAQIRDELLKFSGIDETLFLQIAQSSIPARFEPGRSKEDKISAVQYVKFAVPESARAALAEGAATELVIEHPNYHARARVESATQQCLIEDLQP